MTPFILIAVSFVVAWLRFTVPGHGLTGWPGIYEAFAHIWVGVLLVFCFQTRIRLTAIITVVLISGLELVMFLLRG